MTRYEPDIDFAARQYAELTASGIADDESRERLAAVLGADAVNTAASPTATSTHPSAEAEAVARLAEKFQSNGFAARAAMSAAIGDARVLALDWWRPVRSFLLYAGLLVLLAAALIAFFMVHVLPAFRTLDAMTGVGSHGASTWLMSVGGLRMIVPLACAAALLALLAWASHTAQRSIATLRPLPGPVCWPGIYRTSRDAYALVRRLEQMTAMGAAGIPAQRLPEAMQSLRAQQHERLGVDWPAIRTRLDQARELGTFAAELAWQRREAWSHMQTCWELGRDRLILATRIAFYILVGYVIVALYSPIFSIASQVGVHP